MRYLFLSLFFCLVSAKAQDTVVTVLESPKTVTFSAEEGIITYRLEGSRSGSGSVAAGHRVSEHLDQRGDCLTLRYYPQGKMMADTFPVSMGNVDKVACYIVRVLTPADTVKTIVRDTTSIRQSFYIIEEKENGSN